MFCKKSFKRQKTTLHGIWISAFQEQGIGEVNYLEGEHGVRV